MIKKYPVVGVTFEGRQKILGDFFKSYKHGGNHDVILGREEGNPYDQNAISVSLDVGNADYRKIGYISKNDNVELCGILGKMKKASLNSIGPNYKGDIGVTIEAVFED